MIPNRFAQVRRLATACFVVGLASLTFAANVMAADKAADVKPLPEAKRTKIPKLSGPGTIDCDLTEAVWSKAAVLKPFVLSIDGKPERERTEVRVWYDDNALYLGWICTDSDIQATFTARDSKFWEEEVAEFF